jgi:chromosome segregation protein
LTELEQRIQQGQQQLEAESLQREELQQQRSTLWQHIEEKKQLVNETTHTLHEINLKLQSLTTHATALQQNIQRSETQLQTLEKQRLQAEAGLKDLQSPQEDVQQQLDAALNQRIQMEQSLNSAREKLTNIEQEIREQTKTRNQVEQECNAGRSALERVRLEHQSLEVRAMSLREQLTASEHAKDFAKRIKEPTITTEEIENEVALFELDFPNYIVALLQDLASNLTEKDLEQHLESLVRKIERLGAINLAAIDEYKILAERKTYLDEQNTDLCTALTTLEDAIRKIDKETRLHLIKLIINSKAYFPIFLMVAVLT